MRHYKRWEPSEKEFLRENVGRYSIRQIAKKLNRRETAVLAQLEKLGIGSTKMQTGKLTISELATATGNDFHTVKRWVDRKELKATRKITRQEQRNYFVDIKAFWKFAEQNKARINFARIERNTLLPEPAWVEEERRKDYHEIPKRNRAPWSEIEEKKLIHMYKSDKSAKEIAADLQRGEKAVRSKISKLKAERKIPYKRILIRWSDEEVRMMLEMEEQGFPDEKIAEELGREHLHVVDKRRLLRKQGLYQGYKYERRKENI